MLFIKNINKNIFNNFLIAKSRRTRTRTHLFQKLPSPTPAPESRNAPVLHRSNLYVSLNEVGYEYCNTPQFWYQLNYYTWILKGAYN